MAPMPRDTQIASHHFGFFQDCFCSTKLEHTLWWENENYHAVGNLNSELNSQLSMAGKDLQAAFLCPSSDVCSGE